MRECGRDCKVRYKGEEFIVMENLVSGVEIIIINVCLFLGVVEELNCKRGVVY